MAVTAQQVKELRDRTGVGLGDCKRALEECGGDLDSAVQWLREHGLAKAAKKAGRETREGRINIAVTDDGKRGAMVEINCETDFVARNDEFGRLCSAAVQAAIGDDLPIESADGLLGTTTAGGSTVRECLQETFGRIGENMRVGRVTKYAVGEVGTVASYLHFNSRVGVLVALASATPSGVADPAAAELGKNIAMHIAMAAPEVVSADQLDAERIEKEKALLIEQARQDGKPENTIEKIVEGQLRKLRAEVCLLEQPYIRDEKGKTRIADLLAQTSKQIGEAVSVTAFARYSLDEAVGEAKTE